MKKFGGDGTRKKKCKLRMCEQTSEPFSVEAGGIGPREKGKESEDPDANKAHTHSPREFAGRHVAPHLWGVVQNQEKLSWAPGGHVGVMLVFLWLVLPI